MGGVAFFISEVVYLQFYLKKGTNSFYHKTEQALSLLTDKEIMAT
jgi:hypothetical protein